ncbi:MAG: OB-fold nucleic acid binding domain-containing protein [Oscillatoriaceae cyanobacterium Prado104]|jgi:DNA polymerase-3 subunit alpha|nr:OB-fold nucleic acid binding domain-containing protein [Oscillatoriaceae cyanobacterium Prado104]
MVKIISRKSVGTQKVYDIGVERDHNFILNNGFVASNCFNKSHSMAYAYVTYQTAYLKANYPVEYMAALLTANSGDQDKVQKYIANCLKLGIEVDPPDVNSSDVNFTPLPRKGTRRAKDKIMFGLSAIKNIGEGAIENILTARKEGGEFKSLADLCDRVSLNAVNKRALEALINCGALDKIDKNRNQLMHDLEGVMKWAADRKKDRDSGQGSLFDLLGMASLDNSANTFDSVPKSKPVSDYPTAQKLQFEKELLGFYVSEHPLKTLVQTNQDKDVVTIGELGEKKGKVSIIITIASIKPVVTKKDSRRMAILQIEDLTGKCEAVVFPDTFEKIGALIVDNAILLVAGKIDKREDQIQIIVEDAKPLQAEPLAGETDTETLEEEGNDFSNPFDILPGETEIETPENAVNGFDRPMDIPQATTAEIKNETPPAIENSRDRNVDIPQSRTAEIKNGTPPAVENNRDRTVDIPQSKTAEIKNETPPVVENSRDRSIDISQARKAEIENATPEQQVNVVKPTKPPRLLQVVIVKFTPEQVKNSERINDLKSLLQEFSSGGKDTGVLVGGIVFGKYSCQPFWMGRNLWAVDGAKIYSRLRSAHFDACIYTVTNNDSILAIEKMREQLKLHAWANSLLEADRAKLDRYWHYLDLLEPPW